MKSLLLDPPFATHALQFFQSTVTVHTASQLVNEPTMTAQLLQRTLLPILLFFTSTFALNPPPIKWATGFAYKNCESMYSPSELLDKFRNSTTNSLIDSAHPHAGVQSTDGGFYMVGDGVCPEPTNVHRHIFAMKTDADGILQWQTQIGDIGYNYGKWGIQLEDDNFVIAGSKSVKSRHSKCGYVEQRALWVLSQENGTILSESIFPNDFGTDNRREGIMCINPMGTSGDDEYEYVATGYVGGESGDCNDDEPMFLIFGGFAFLAKLVYDPTTHSFDAQMEVTFNSSDITDRMIPMQGMRVFDDVTNQRIGISAASHVDGDDAVQFGMISIDYSGATLWSNLYPAAHDEQTGSGSHPYSMIPSSTNDGYVISGLALREKTGVPEGRMVKIGSDGDLLWDRRFVYSLNGHSAEMSVECYGVSVTMDKGYITTCGTGWEGQVEGQVNGVNDRDTWMALLHRTDIDGNVQWQKAYTNQSSGNNAGEFVVTTAEGGYAMYIDANSFGPPETGGNFGLMVLEQEK